MAQQTRVNSLQSSRGDSKWLVVCLFVSMQRLLNEDCKKRKKEMNDLNNELSKSNKWKMNKSPFSQVNYVSTFDYHCRK